MVHSIDIRRVEDIIQYQFRNTGLLAQALQAPVKIEDKSTKAVLHADEGNRMLAQLGQKVIELIVIDLWYHAGSDRGSCSSTLKPKRFI